MDRPDRLSKAFVDRVEAPGRYSDGRGSHGLTLLVRPRRDGSMAKHWAQHLRIDGKLRSFGLGTYPVVKLAEARTKATALAARVRETHPVRPRVSAFERMMGGASMPASTAAPPFSEVAEAAVEYNAAKWKGGKTAEQRRRLIRSYLAPVFGDVPIDRVHPEHVTEALRPIWHSKRATAKKVWAVLVSTFDFAVGQRYITQTDDPLPAAKRGLGKQEASTAHHEALPYDRVHDCYRTFRDTDAPGSVSRVIEMAILTAGRKSEVMEATWAEIDMDGAVWTIPPERMKSGREHRIPLAPPVLDLLRRAREEDSPETADALVFPNGGGRPVSAAAPNQRLNRHFDGITLHGFRSTFRDWVADRTDYPGELAEHALAHLVGDSTVRAYRRTDYFEKRRALMDEWAAFVTE